MFFTHSCIWLGMFSICYSFVRTSDVLTFVRGVYEESLWIAKFMYFWITSCSLMIYDSTFPCWASVRIEDAFLRFRNNQITECCSSRIYACMRFISESFESNISWYCCLSSLISWFLCSLQLSTSYSFCLSSCFRNSIFIVSSCSVASGLLGIDVLLLLSGAGRRSSKLFWASRIAFSSFS